jgi:hypothetical protein
MWSNRKEGYAKPADVSLDDFTFITCNEPPRWSKDAGYLAAFKKVFGAVAAVYLDLFSKVPMNIDPSFVGPGVPVEVEVNAAPPSGEIPPVGEPVWVARLEKKIDGILEMLAIR